MLGALEWRLEDNIRLFEYEVTNIVRWQIDPDLNMILTCVLTCGFDAPATEVSLDPSNSHRTGNYRLCPHIYAIF
jgi:hypothetical protein